MIQMEQKKLDRRKAVLNWGPDIKSLPEYSWQEVREHVREGASLIVIDNIVYDVTEFKKKHPGGEKMISIRLGEDCTEAFNGTIYNHGWGARHLLALLRTGRIRDPENVNAPEKIQTW